MQIGFSQPLERSWLDAALDWTASGKSPDEVREQLDALLARKIAVGTTSKKSSRYKRVCQLMTAWVTPRKPLIGLRDHALQVAASGSDRATIHYLMLSASYPFFWAVSSQVGRLLRLQDHFTTAQLSRRSQELLGQRETVSYAATRVVRTLVDLGIITRSDKTGTYSSSKVRRITETPLVEIVIETVFSAEGQQSILLDPLITHPGLFPFALPMTQELLPVNWERIVITGGEHASHRVSSA